jgi:hypothetical protein
MVRPDLSRDTIRPSAISGAKALLIVFIDTCRSSVSLRVGGSAWPCRSTPVA